MFIRSVRLALHPADSLVSLPPIVPTSHRVTRTRLHDLAMLCTRIACGHECLGFGMNNPYC
jgi:hypothetical protein